MSASLLYYHSIKYQNYCAFAEKQKYITALWHDTIDVDAHKVQTTNNIRLAQTTKDFTCSKIKEQLMSF